MYSMGVPIIQREGAILGDMCPLKCIGKGKLLDSVVAEHTCEPATVKRPVVKLL